VVAVDGVEALEPLLAAAAAWSRQLLAPLRVVTVYEPVPADIRRPRHLYERPALLLVVGGRRPGLHATGGILGRLLREMPLPILVVNRW
jgi:nucleotide-binding universal stress UspA family protein